MRIPIERSELFSKEKTFFQIFWDEMESVFGFDGFYEGIFQILSDYENGQCGVETTYFVYPALLIRQRKKTPKEIIC